MVGGVAEHAECASVCVQCPDHCLPNPSESFTVLNAFEKSLSNHNTKQRFSGSDPGLWFWEEMDFIVTFCLLGLQKSSQALQFL